MANTEVLVPSDIRGLVLSATELRALTGWPEPLIEDYLSILDSLRTLANAINVKNDILKTVSPGWSKATKTAKFAWEPEWGCTLA